MHENYDRAIKLNIIACIADLLLGLGPTAEHMVPKILEITNLCFQAVYEFSSNYFIIKAIQMRESMFKS